MSFVLIFLFIFAPETQASKQVVGTKECPKAYSGAPVSMISHCKDKDIFPTTCKASKKKQKVKQKK